MRTSSTYLTGACPACRSPMRLGWSQRDEFIAFDFSRPSPPIGGSITGMSDGLAAPPFPPSLASDPTLFLGIWLAGDPDVVEITGGGAEFGNKRPLTLEGGKVGGTPGVYVVSTARLRPLEGTIFRVTITARALSRNPTLPPMPAIPTPTTCPRPARAAGLSCCMSQRQRLGRPRD